MGKYCWFLLCRYGEKEKRKGTWKKKGKKNPLTPFVENYLEECGHELYEGGLKEAPS